MNSGTVICGIDTNNNIKNYRILLYRFDKNTWNFSKLVLPESELIEAIRSRKIALRNAEIKLNSSGRWSLVGSTGGLSRFDPENGHRPIVIISEIKNLNGNTIGYKVVKYDGTVTNLRLDAILSYCARVSKLGLIPIQNAMYIDSDSQSHHIRGYVENQFVEEKMNIDRRNLENTKELLSRTRMIQQNKRAKQQI